LSDSLAGVSATETTLHVEWAHALAPDARIVVVVVASTHEPSALAGAVEYAAAGHLGNVISNSYGWSEASDDGKTLQRSVPGCGSMRHRRQCGHG
jgi:subtilase family serine protease